MSRRKQQNPKPCKYDLENPSLKSGQENRVAEFEEECCVNGSPSSPSQIDQPPSPQMNDVQPDCPESASQSLTIKGEPVSPQSKTAVSPEKPDHSPENHSLESLLGIPEEAPLKVENIGDGKYRILTSKPIIKGAGLDPLRAQKIESPENSDELETSSQIVSFIYKEMEVAFLLDSSINCGWLKHLGTPDEEKAANLRIYFVGNQLWVEVIKNLSENEQLIAEFCDPTQDMKADKMDTEPSKPKNDGPNSSQDSPSPSLSTRADLQFPCQLCGISFRNPNTLMAHKKHYCSKAVTPATTSFSESNDQPPATSSGDQVESANLQSAYLCQVCKYMTLTQSDMETHVQEKHSTMESSLRNSRSVGPTDKTYCEDCEIHFKKPESYLAHKRHYCKNRSSSLSPRSEANHSSQNSISQAASPTTSSVKDLYRKVSIFDNVNTNMTSQAAAAAAAVAAAASLPFPLSSLLTLPGMATLPMMPLKMLQSPVLMAQALQTMLQTNSSPVNGKVASPSKTTEPEIPLDLTVKPELAFNSAGKRKAEGLSETSPPVKRQVSSSSVPSTSPAPTNTVLQLNNHLKPNKPERPIYRCESCSIPFYKKEVYEAHRLHYCSQRGSTDMEHDLPAVPVKIPEPKALPTSPTAASVADERLVITYTCNKCSTSYRTIETFKAHKCSLPEESTSSEVLCCEECNFTTVSKQILLEHAETHQKSSVMYKCSLCGYHGNTMRGMRQHGRQHMLKGEEFLESDIVILESPTPVQKMLVPPTGIPLPINHKNVDEELLRLKNEPYKKRRSRKHYQKAECMQPAESSKVLLQRKENNMQRPRSLSPQSNSTSSCTSPLQVSTTNVPNSDTQASLSPSIVSIKSEPKEANSLQSQIGENAIASSNGKLDKKLLPPVKSHICSCNASFASPATFEAHKKHYCPHNKSKQTNPTITVTH